MGSRGSVIPLFINQVLEKQPITLTDPNMTRFMMSVDGAIDLVLYAFEKGKSGDMFVQKAPAATVRTLAEAIQIIFNATNEIQIIGTRHGEKLYETLLNREEMADAEDLGAYYRIPADCRDLNYSCYFTEGEHKLSVQEDYNSHNTRRLNVDEMIELLLKVDFVRDALNNGRVSNSPQLGGIRSSGKE
jgi:UDP-glucose 4-epimerase